jgi:hypothetical protein
LVPLTDEIASGSWPTPTSNDYKNAGYQSAHGQDFLTLPGAVGAAPPRGGWPTPTSRDHKDGSYCPNMEVNGLLGRAVWPTPTANRWDGLQSHGVNVVSGSLNPTFVEFLMGFPRDFTRIGPTASGPVSPASPVESPTE